MAENYLITGYWGEPHVTSENDRGINAAIFGAGRFVLPVGEQFRAEYIGNNTVRIFDGKLIDNGAVAGIPAGEYIDLLIPEAGQGMSRNDLIIFQYSQDASTLIESGVFMVLPGEETSGEATDPALSQQDILTNEAALDQMALWRVPVSGSVISAPVQLFDVSRNMRNAGFFVAEATSDDGVAYSATVPGVNELYAGLEVTIIPNVASATTAPTLNVNGLGAKNIRLPVSTNTAMLAQPDTETYFVDGRPVKLMYDTKYIGKGAWVVVGKQLQSGNDIYGTVPVQKGGFVVDNNTTSEDKAEAIENLSKIGALCRKRELTTSDDLNNIKEDGVYYYATATATNGLKNAPFDAAAVIMVFGADNTTSQKIQIAFRYGEPGYFKSRSLLSGSWLAWKQYATTDYADSKVGMDLLWENASRTSTFAAETEILVDITAYNFLAVEVAYNEKEMNGTELCFVGMRKKNFGDTAATLTAHLITSTGSFNTVSRKLTIRSGRGGIDAGGGIAADGSANDKNAIPVKIYGIRGI